MEKAPFTKDFVLGVTIDHQIKAVEFSIKKTLARAYASSTSPELNKEIVMTLQTLITWRQDLAAARKQYDPSRECDCAVDAQQEHHPEA